MNAFKVQLKEGYPFLQGGELSCLIAEFPFNAEKTDGWKRPAVIVVPGGGYRFVSKRESEPIANAFLGKGFNAFILDYLCVGDGVRYPEQLLELSAAVDYVRKRAKELDVNPDEIFVVGFSAGGHLVGNLAIECETLSQKVGTELDCKPTAVGLCYAVTSNRYGHIGSHENLLNGYSQKEKEGLYSSVNLDLGVTESTPPAFIWTTAEDLDVPSQNSLRYAMALAEKGVSYELHVYPRGKHGLSNAAADVNLPHPDLGRISRWIEDCVAYFRSFTQEKF